MEALFSDVFQKPEDSLPDSSETFEQIWTDVGECTRCSLCEGRTNIVLSRDPAFAAPGILVAPSIDAALAAARGDALRRCADAIAVIGGAEIYAQWMDVADRLEVTEVHARPEGDTYLAAIDPADWEQVARARYSASSDDSADYSYVTYRRRKSH